MKGLEVRSAGGLGGVGGKQKKKNCRQCLAAEVLLLKKVGYSYLATK